MSFGITAAGVTAAAAVGGLGLSAYNTFAGGKGGGMPGSMGGYDVVNLPTYDFTEPRFREMSDFVTEQFANIRKGGIPLWLERQLPTIRGGLNRGLESTFYGLPGQRTGAIPTALSAAAITGAGSGVAQRQVSRQLQNYAEQAKRIDEFIAEQTLQGTQETIRSAGQIGLGIPQGPPAQVVQYGGYSPQPAPSMAPALGQLAQTFGNMYGQQQKPQAQAAGYASYGGGASYLPPADLAFANSRSGYGYATSYPTNYLSPAQLPSASYPNRYESFNARQY